MPPSTNYTPSVNIIRDQSRDINYIPTSNAIQVAQLIWDSLQTGIRAFNLIGSYGTGKSSFLWAFEQSSRAQKQYFPLPFKKGAKVDFLNCVGEHKSLKAYFAAKFNLNIEDADITQKILAEIYQQYHNLGKGTKALFVVIDEFGKFLEYAAKHNPEDELYFIQQLAEFANNPDHAIILVTSVHQNFEAYAYGLSPLQRQEWAKVKGRFREVAFNETVEQLLFLAAERTDQLNLGTPNKKSVATLCKLYDESKAFATKAAFAEKTALKLYPLELFSANTLTLALQRYGQNERSLFSFLENTDYTGIHTYQSRTNPFYNVANVYDYLIFNLYSFLLTPQNPDRSAWSGIKSALERVESQWEEGFSDAHRMVKTIGLLNLFVQSGATLDEKFLIIYAKTALGIEAPETTLQKLVDSKIILYRKHQKRFVLFEGTDIDIHETLELAGKQVEITDIATLVERNYSLQPIFAKAHYYKTGTPRLFEFKISSHPVHKIFPSGEIDGFINLIFNEKLSETEVLKASAVQEECVLYGFYRNAKAIKELLFDIESTKRALKDINARDAVARREFESILNHQQYLLNHYILNNLHDDSKAVCWVYKGEYVAPDSKKGFNELLSKICADVYEAAPSYRNELVNRHKLPAPLHQAKRNYLRALTNSWVTTDLGFEADKFPPEKTIFITLLRENGLVFDASQPYKDIAPVADNTFYKLWAECVSFLESTKTNRRRISELTDILSKRPYKLKQGLLDFWLPSFLFIKKSEFALFNKDAFIPEITEETLELIVKNPEQFEIKAFNLDGVRLDIFNNYRMFLSQNSSTTPSKQIFIETIKPFLTFYVKLPDYAKNTRRLSKEASALRAAIAASKDPEKTFFEDFPQALGFSIKQLKSDKKVLEIYSLELQNAIREIRTCSDELFNRVEGFIVNDLLGLENNTDFERYKATLQERYKALKRHLLLPAQKVFVQRLFSELDDKRAWLGSLVQALLGKNMEQMRDEDELVLYERLQDMISNLDNLTNVSKSTVDESIEEVFSLEITSFEQSQKNILRLPKKKQKEVSILHDKLKSQLGTDKTANMAALVQLIQELLKK